MEIKFRMKILNFLCLSLFTGLLTLAGCALYRWNIHAPGLLSQNFISQIQPQEKRVGLYLTPDTFQYQSTLRGGKTADPQTYYIGESFAPMVIEAFQHGFTEFIFLETEPTQDILTQYAIPYVAVTRLKEFSNKVTWKGQEVALLSETILYDTQMKPLTRVESQGVSGAVKVFAKKGGPEVNLNAALENNVLSIVQYVQDFLNR